MEGGFKSPAKKKLKIGDCSGAEGGLVDVFGGHGGNGAAGRGGASSALARDGGSGFVLSGGSGGSPGGGSDATNGEAEGVDLDVHASFVHDLVVQRPHVEMEVGGAFQAAFEFSDEEVDSDRDYEYFSGSDVDVERSTYKSFVEKEEKKLRRKGLDGYMPFDKEFYRCKYHPNKPADGLRVGLVQHVRSLAVRAFDKDGREDLGEKGRHEALLRVFEPDDFEYVEPEEPGE